MRLLLALFVCLPIVKAGAQVTPLEREDPAALIPRLDKALSGVDDFTDSMVGALRADSGTIRGDSLYLRFRDSLQRRIDLATRPFWGMASKQIDPTNPVIRDLVSHGVHTFVGEGDVYMTVDLGRLLDRVGPFLTREMRVYVGLTLDEQRRPCCGDAAIGISWDELGSRVAGYDRFTSNYPNAAAATEAAAEYRILFGLFLTGADNTPAFSRSAKRMTPMVRESLARYAGAHRGLQSGQVVADYLSLLKANNYELTPAVARFLRVHHGAMSGGG